MAKREINLTGGTTRAELALSWQDRMKDAEALHATGRNAVAIMLAIYSIEIYLKVRIYDKLDIQKLPMAFQIHELEDLLILCGLSNILNGTPMQGTKVKQNWDSVRDVSAKLTILRYERDSNWYANDAQAVLTQLNDPQDGVLTWLQKQP
jgi:hypothetical protein